MNHTSDRAGPAAAVEWTPGDTMHSVIKRLEADVAARKQPRSEVWPPLRIAIIAVGIFICAYALGLRSASGAGAWATGVAASGRGADPGPQVDALNARLDFQKLQLERMQRAFKLSSKYGIGADLATSIEDIALAENVDPSLAFELVRVESGFNARAVSPVGAIGYTQLMPATARLLLPGITRAQLFERDTNLRLGFRFFRTMINHYHGDIRLALLAYNRGPETVDRLLAAGKDPGNGYAKLVLGK